MDINVGGIWRSTSGTNRTIANINGVWRTGSDANPTIACNINGVWRSEAPRWKIWPSDSYTGDETTFDTLEHTSYLSGKVWTIYSRVICRKVAYDNISHNTYLPGCPAVNNVIGAATGTMTGGNVTAYAYSSSSNQSVWLVKTSSTAPTASIWVSDLALVVGKIYTLNLSLTIP